MSLLSKDEFLIRAKSKLGELTYKIAISLSYALPRESCDKMCSNIEDLSAAIRTLENPHSGLTEKEEIKLMEIIISKIPLPMIVSTKPGGNIITTKPKLLRREILGSNGIYEGNSGNYRLVEIYSDGSIVNRTAETTWEQPAEGTWSGMFIKKLAIPITEEINGKRYITIAAVYNNITYRKLIAVEDAPVTELIDWLDEDFEYNDWY